MRHRKPKPDDLAASLRDEIVAGRFPPGTLLVQDTLAKTYGVSRIPVREALKQLASDGLVDIAFGDGASVHRPDRAEVAEIFELRIHLEPYLLRQAIPRLGPRDFETAEAALVPLRAESSTIPASTLDWRFHAALFSAADRPLYLKIIGDLRAKIAGLVNLGPLAENRLGLANDLAALLHTVRSGDEKEATGRMVRKLIHAREALLHGLAD